MQLTLQSTSLIFLLSAILSVHTSPVPSNYVNVLDIAVRNDVPSVARAIDLERRQRGGAGAGGAGGAARGGAAGGVSHTVNVCQCQVLADHEVGGCWKCWCSMSSFL